MFGRGVKKGLSTIVSTLLILLLVFVAIGILWVVIRNVIQDGSEQISLGKFTLDLKIEQVQISENTNQISVKVKRNSGDGEFVGMKFIFSDGDNTEIFDRNLSLKVNEKKTYDFILLNINASEIESVSIAPIFLLSSGKESVGDIKDSWERGIEDISSTSQDEEIITTQCTVDSECATGYNSTYYCSSNNTQVLRDVYTYSCNLNLFICQTATTIQIVETCQSGYVCQSGSCVQQQAQIISNAKIISVSASGHQPSSDYIPEKTLDGNLNDESRWSSEGSNEWIRYELNQTTYVSYVRIAFLGSASRYFDIQYSTDGSNWVNTSANGLTSAPNLANQYQTFNFDFVQARYLRFVGHGSSQPSLWNSIVEMDINGFDSTVEIIIPPTASCNDGIQNQGETGIDCGGPCNVCSPSGKVIVYQNNFEDNPLGLYSSLNVFYSDWRATSGGNRWDKAKTVSGISGNPTKVLELTYPFYDVADFRWICWGDSRCDDGRGGRKEFTSKPSFGNSQFLEGVGPDSGGGSWNVDFGGSYTDIYLSYKFKFEEGFNPVDGGKLPGFCGGHCPGGGTVSDIDGDGTSDGFSARMMFESEGNGYPINLRYYIYHIDQSGFYGDSAVFSKGISSGEWHTVVQRVQMNTLNSPNGVLEAWLDGELVLRQTGFTFRKGASANFGIDSVYFTSFFGGSASQICTDSQVSTGAYGCAKYSDGSNYYFYAPRRTEHAYFDDIEVYYQ